MTTTRIAVICVLACACGRHLNPEFCATHPGNPDCVPEDATMIDGGPCTTDMECKNPLPVCDTARGMCVECTPAKNVCHNPAPVCDMTDMCVPMECNSNVVLPDGTCVDGSRVIYVQPGPDTMTACDDLMRACSLSEGLKHLSPRDIIHLADGTYPGPLSIDSPNVTAILFGLHATLSGGTPVLTIPTGSKVDLDYVTVSNGNGGVSCATGATLGIRGASIRNNQMDYGVTSACALTIDGASVFGNTSGALDVTGGTFDVRNSAMFNNGSSNLRSSPVLLEVAGSFTFNTVTHNTTKSGGGPPASGVECQVNSSDRGNIIVGNTGSNQTAGNCFAGSLTNISATQVMWVGFPPATAADLHLTAGSPARNVAGLDCSMDPTDIDGEPRPMGGLCDQGADEYKE